MASSPEALQAFRTAGFTKQNVLEIVVVIALKVLSNYTNHIVDTQVDGALDRFAWTRPAADAT